MNSARTAGLSFVLVASIGAICAVQAQQNQESDISHQVKAGLAECDRKYPDEIKQAVANAMCAKKAMEPLRRTTPYPDLINLETSKVLMMAEKLQNRKITLIEAKAAAAQIHSEIVAELQRRQLATAAAAAAARSAAAPARSAPAPTPSAVTIDNSPPPVYQSDAPRLQNNLPQQTRCQTMRVGTFLETVCR